MRACPIASSAAVPINTPMRGTRSRCCARAASGHAVAAPPSSVTISRRFIVVTYTVGPRPALHQNRKDRRTEGRCDNVRCGNPEQFMSLQCQLGKSQSGANVFRFAPEKRTKDRRVGHSLESRQKRTSH